VPDKIFEVAECGLSDGHPFIFLYGNPTRSTGKFYRVCFGNEQDGWVHKAIDSRDCTLSNKELHRGLDCNYGEDSDFVRVRVRGLPTAADELQFIERETIQEAQMRKLHSLLADPLACGVDVSGGGAAWNVRRIVVIQYPNAGKQRRPGGDVGKEERQLMICLLRFSACATA
jgi:hypothetical protein